MRVFALFSILACSLASGQRPPVILIDGYHLLCQSENLSSPHDFGEMEPRLQAQGVRVIFFGTCSYTGKPSLETLGNALGTVIRNLNVPQVDLASHSTGGLIVRSYLSGKQDSGRFTPRADPKVRKWVSIATPNFGALIPGGLFDFLPDVQARELAPGSQFLFDLATWNQNHDDLRGVDAVAIIGNAGGFGPFESAATAPSL
jgi:pimeloyl-ACP methyl ester carboxylesterase